MTPQLTIMVVDDHPDGRYLVECRLKKAFEDCAIISCGSASEALGFLEGQRIDAIITDNKLGGESGCELTSDARRLGITCPVVMVTASDDPRVQNDAYAAGVTEIFQGGRGDFANFLRQLLRPTSPPHRREAGRQEIERLDQLSRDGEEMHRGFGAAPENTGANTGKIELAETESASRVSSRPAQLRLYVGGRSVRAEEAKANLRKICAGLGAGMTPPIIETIDVFECPDRMLEDGITVTPTLLRLFPQPPLRIIGTLSDTSRVRETLGLSVGAEGISP